MAHLEFINYTPMNEVVEGRVVRWVPDKVARKIEKLPQIYWHDGVPWHEANQWALTRNNSAGSSPAHNIAGADGQDLT